MLSQKPVKKNTPAIANFMVCLPQLRGDASGHRGGNAQGLMDSDEIVM
jgi:hypothetical protein